VRIPKRILRENSPGEYSRRIVSENSPGELFSSRSRGPTLFRNIFSGRTLPEITHGKLSRRILLENSPGELSRRILPEKFFLVTVSAPSSSLPFPPLTTFSEEE